MSEKYLRDWLNPNASVVDEREREWLNPDTPVEIAPPPTPVVPEEEPEDSYWSGFTKWAKPIAEPVLRGGVRAADDLYNGVQDILFLDTPRANWEDEWLGKPDSAVGDIAAELGSWLVSFAVPGGVVSTGVKGVGKLTGVSSKVSKLTDLIGKSKRGQAVLKTTKVATEGALKGAVADFLATDVGDLRGEEALYKRLEDTYQGAAIGAGANLTLKGVQKITGMSYRRIKALRDVKKAAEGKGDSSQALKALKESIDEEEALKEEFLSTIRPVDDRVDRVFVDDTDKLSRLQEQREFDELFREVGGDPEDIPEIDLRTINWDEVDMEEAVDVAPRVPREELEAIEAGGKLVDEVEAANAIVRFYEMPSGSTKTVMVDKANPDRVIDAAGVIPKGPPQIGDGPLKAQLKLDQPFYVLKDGKQFGPLSRDQVLTNLENGTLKQDDLVAQEGGKKWFGIGRFVDELYEMEISTFGIRIDPKTKDFLTKGDEPKTVSNTLEQLTKNADDEDVRNLAKSLRELISDPEDLNVPIKYDPETEKIISTPEGDAIAQGTYDIVTDKINLYKGTDEETLVHEILHGVVSRKLVGWIGGGKKTLKDVTANNVDVLIQNTKAPKAVREVASSFKQALEHPSIDNSIYPMQDIDEFLVGAFTDKNLQELLSKIPVEDNRNLFQKIVDAVANLIGVKGADSTLLSKVIRDGAEIISTSRKQAVSPEFTKGLKKLEERQRPQLRFSRKEPQYAEAQIEKYIDQGKNLPDQINRLVRLNVELDNRMNPKINELVESLSDFDERLVQGVDTNLQEQFDSIKNGVLNLEVDLQRYRKMIDIRAKAGNLSGKMLVAFKGLPKINFRKPVKYKPAVQKQLLAIDRLLTLIDDVKTGKLSDEKVLTKLKRELKNADDIANTGDLKSAVEKEFDATVDESIETIWDKYKSRISDQVLKALRLNKGTNKAALDLFSDRITKTLTNAVKPNKAVTKTVNKTLDNLQDILSNPEKYKESIDVLIKDISTAKNLDPEAASDAVRILNDLKDGVQGKRFLEAMPNRDELIQKVLKEETDRLTTKIKKAVKEGTEKELVEEVVSDISSRVTNLGLQEKEVLIDMIRAELGNTVSAIREQVIGNFITKEIYQKYALKQTIEEMDEMAGKSIAEIRDYLGATAKRVQTVPDDIRRLKEQARASRKVLTDRLKDEETAAYNEFVKDFLQSLGKMDAFGMEEMGNFELFLRAAEKFRLNSLLFSVRTWTVGLLSSGFNMAYQPFKQMLKKYSEVKQLQKAGVDSVYGPNASAMKLALKELTATAEYFNNWGDMFNILKATWKQNGHGAFNAKAFRRHEEDLISKTTKDEAEALKKSPIKLNFKNKEHLQRMVNKYGVDNERSKGLIRKFFEDIVEGEPTTKIGKLFDPLFSVSFRAMGLFDQPFVFMGTMRALRAQALQEGLVKGLEGSALERFTKERMQEALKREGDVLTWAKNEEFKEASELGFTMVYQQEYADKTISNIAKEFSRWSRSSEDAYRRVDKILARLFVPFIKTPTAIAQWTVDNMPVVAQVNGTRALMGMNRSAKKLKEVNETILQNTQALKATPITKDQIKQIEDANEVLMGQREELVLKSAEEQAEAISNAVSSTVLGAGIFTAISTGTMTGSGAHLSDDQRQRLRESGWRPNTIYIGDHKIDYSRFEPFSTMVSVWADVMHYKALADEGLTEDDQEWYNVLHASFMTNFADKYFLRGLKSLFSLLDQRPGNYNLEKIGVDFLSSLSPTIIRDINQMNEEFQTKAHGFKDKLLERSFGKFPGLYARNLLGEKVERQWQMEGAWGLVSPVYFAEDKRDKLMLELASIREDVGGRYSFNKTEVQKIDTRDYRDAKTGISLHDKWMDEMSSVRINGKTLRKTLERLVRTSRYKKASNFEVVGDEDTKANLVREVLSDFRKRAWSNIRKDRKLRRYEDSDGNNWFDVITGETSLIQTSTKERLGVVGISLPEQ